MMIISQVNELTDEEKENIRQLFTLMLLSVTMKEDKLTNVHPIDFASYVVFLCLTVWKTHTKEEGFTALISVLKSKLNFDEYPDFWETVMDEAKAIQEARNKTKQVDVMGVITMPDEKDIN